MSPANGQLPRTPENCHQEQIMRWWAYYHKRLGCEEWELHHSPNGGSRHKAEAARLKAQGVRPGYPDLLLDVPRGAYHGLRIELKAIGGKLSDDQKKWLKQLQARGFHAVMCVGYDEAVAVIEKYLRT